MEYQKIINLLDNTLNQLSKRRRNWVEINDDRNGTYDEKISSYNAKCKFM